MRSQYHYDPYRCHMVQCNSVLLCVLCYSPTTPCIIEQAITLYLHLMTDVVEGWGGHKIFHTLTFLLNFVRNRHMTHTGTV